MSFKKRTFLSALILCLIIVFSGWKDPVGIYRDYSLMPVSELISRVFSEKDILFLGENHRIEQHVGLVAQLIPVLQKAGVHILFSEFANHSDTRRSDSILTAREYDEFSVRAILHNCEWDWAYQEYADIYKAAWTVNRNLKPGELPFRIIGLQPDLNHAAIQKAEDWDSSGKRKDYWNYANNKTWLDIIESEALSKNRKALVHCGLHHAFTKYHHPIVIDGKFIRFEKDREGTVVYNKYPSKVSMSVLYSYHPEKPGVTENFVAPFNGVIDSLIQTLPPNKREFGFITVNSSLGLASDTSSLYSMGYRDLLLKDFCDILIVTGSVCDFKTVTIIDDFVTEENLQNTIIQSYPYHYRKDWTVKACNDSIKKWLKEESVILKKRQHCNELLRY